MGFRASLSHLHQAPEGSSGKLSFKQHFVEGILDGLSEVLRCLMEPRDLVGWNLNLKQTPKTKQNHQLPHKKMGLLGFLGKYFYHQKVWMPLFFVQKLLAVGKQNKKKRVVILV